MQTNIVDNLVLSAYSQTTLTSIGRNASTIWEWLAPKPEDRILLSRSNFLPLLGPGLGMFGLMSLLARRPHTRFYRLALMPVASLAISRLAFVVQWCPPHILSWNVAATAGSLALLTRTLEFGLSPSGVERIGEKFAGEAHLSKDNSWFDSLYWAIYDSIDIGCNMRGIGWKFGTGAGVRIPPHTRPVHDRKAWLWSTFKTIFIVYLLFDLGSSLGDRKFPEIRNQIGESIWVPYLPPLVRYTVSTLITAMAAVVVVVYLTMWYDIVGFLAVLVLKQDPASWPPLFGQPWFAESIHEFWAFHWHQLMRRTLLVSLGNPLGSIFGQAGTVFGAFLASGLYHSLMLNGDGASGISWETVGMFTVQSLGMLLERAFRKITGKRVGGIWGNIWTALWITIISQPAENAWLQRQDFSVRLIPAKVSIVEFLYRWWDGVSS